MKGSEHTVHVFSRLLTATSHGMAVYACTANRFCRATETRKKGHPSPYALRKRQRVREARESAAWARRFQ